MGTFPGEVIFEGVPMLESAQEADGRTAEGLVEFWATGTHAKGEYHCAECGYAVTVHSILPVCPACAGESWEQAPWSPLSRSR